MQAIPLFILLLAPIPDAKKPTPELTAKELAAARDAIYTSELTSEQARDESTPSLIIPNPLAELFKRNPAAVLDLLLRIADGGRAEDSFRAVCYAIALTDGGIAADLTASRLEETVPKYEQVSEKWGVTHREHWVDVVKVKRTKK